MKTKLSVEEYVEGWRRRWIWWEETWEASTEIELVIRAALVRAPQELQRLSACAIELAARQCGARKSAFVAPGCIGAHISTLELWSCRSSCPLRPSGLCIDAEHIERCLRHEAKMAGVRMR